MAARVDGKGSKKDRVEGKNLNGSGDDGLNRVAATGETAKDEPAPENPLVPNEVLRQIYRKMVELRLLDEYARRLKRGSKAKRGWRSIRGQEACRVSVAQELSSDDLILDSQPGSLMDHLLGAELAEVLTAGDAKKRPVKPSSGAKRLLPFVEETEARLFSGIGAALALQRMKRPDVVVIFLSDAADGAVRRALTLAAAENLAMIFIILAGRKRSKSKKKTDVCRLAHGCGVPGIPVDTSDAVAMYRVTQETVGRLRGGGGPVLVECVPFRLAGAKKKDVADPIEQLGGLLLQRRVATKAWMAEVESNFRKRLAAVKIT